MTFEELDCRRTPLGELILRRRTEPTLGVEVYEIRLGDAFLMTSLFTEGETALARLALVPLGRQLTQAFARTEAKVVTFPNPLHGGDSSNTIYLAHR